MASSIRILVGLAAGFLFGVLAATSHARWLLAIVAVTNPLGDLFIHGILVCVIPLVTSSLIVGFAGSSRHQLTRRLTTCAVALMLLFLFAAAVFSESIAAPLLRHISPVEVRAPTPQANAPVGASTKAYGVSSLLQALPQIIPSNIFQAASSGALLPLVAISIAFGIALLRVDERRRAAVVLFFDGVAHGFAVLTGFVIRIAPFGVFCLATRMATQTGFRAAGALVYYVVVLSAICLAFAVFIVYPAVALFSRVSVLQFAKATAPTQLLAFSSRSSLAALPVAHEAAIHGLGVQPELAGVFLPLAASLFRVGGCIAQVVGLLFLTRFYGVALHPGIFLPLCVSAVVVSMTVPGVPGGAILVMAPLLTSAGIPLQGLGMLLAVDSLPDMFRTFANVTGWLGVATLLPQRAEAAKTEA